MKNGILFLFLFISSLTSSCSGEDSQVDLEPGFNSLAEQQDYLWMWKLFENVGTNVSDFQLTEEELSKVENIFNNGPQKSKLFAFVILGTINPIQDFEPRLMTYLKSNESMKCQAACEVIKFKLTDGKTSEATYLKESKEIKKSLADIISEQNPQGRERKMLDLTLDLINKE